MKGEGGNGGLEGLGCVRGWEWRSRGLRMCRRAGMEILEAWEVEEGGNGGLEGLGCRGGWERRI